MVRLRFREQGICLGINRLPLVLKYNIWVNLSSYVDLMLIKILLKYNYE